MDTNKSSPHLQNRQNMSGLLLADWNWLHPIVVTFNTLFPVGFYIQWCGALQRTRWRSYLKKKNFPALEVKFLEKLPQLVALQIFQTSYLNCAESRNDHILTQYYKTHVKHIFEKISSITTWSYYHHEIGSMTHFHCLGLGHETMVCAVCLSVFLKNALFSSWSVFTLKSK